MVPVYQDPRQARSAGPSELMDSFGADYMSLLVTIAGDPLIYFTGLAYGNEGWLHNGSRITNSIADRRHVPSCGRTSVRARLLQPPPIGATRATARQSNLLVPLGAWIFMAGCVDLAQLEIPFQDGFVPCLGKLSHGIHHAVTSGVSYKQLTRILLINGEILAESQ